MKLDCSDHPAAWVVRSRSEIFGPKNLFAARVRCHRPRYIYLLAEEREALLEKQQKRSVMFVTCDQTIRIGSRKGIDKVLYPSRPRSKPVVEKRSITNPPANKINTRLQVKAVPGPSLRCWVTLPRQALRTDVQQPAPTADVPASQHPWHVEDEEDVEVSDKFQQRQTSVPTRLADESTLT
jgi:hypothetical protein